MLRSRSALPLFVVTALIVCVDAAHGQPYPSRPVRLVTSQAGGNNDFGARIIAQPVADSLGQPFIVDNRPNGIIPPGIVAKAAPDGYTLLVYNNGFWLGPLAQKSPYDPVKDFAPITVMSVALYIFVVNPSVPANTVKELIALAKAKPGELNYANTGKGSSSYLAGELFKAMAGVDMVSIPFKGAAQALIDVVANRVQLMIPPATATMPHVKAGRLKALAITSAEPSAMYPGIPTVAESGLPGYEMVSRLGIFAPAKTPNTIINRLNQEIVRVLKTREAKEKFARSGVEVLSSTPEEFGKMVKSEIATISKALKSAGVQPK